MNELITLENRDPKVIFTKEGIDPLLDEIKKVVENFKPDMNTAKGRDEIKSVAYKVSQTKSYLEECGKKLTEDWRLKTSVVNEARKKMKTELDELKNKVRKPLTDWEDKEKKRQELYCNQMQSIKNLADRLNGLGERKTIEDLKRSICLLENITIDESWEEYEGKAQEIKENSLSTLKMYLEAEEKRIEQEIELETLREEKKINDQKERDRIMKQEAADKAKAEAKEEAQREREEIERKAKLEKEKIEQEKKDAEDREAKALADKKKAEQDKQDTELKRIREAGEAKTREEEQKAQADLDKKEAEDKARHDEKQRQKKEQEEIAEATRRREADLAHRTKINNAAKDAFMIELGFTDTESEEIIIFIAKNKIPHIKINY
jgi:hypothetical protein